MARILSVAPPSVVAFTMVLHMTLPARHASAPFAHDSEIGLSDGEALLASEAVPLHRRRIILHHAVAELAHHAEIGLSVGVARARLGSTAEPLHRRRVILRHAARASASVCADDASGFFVRADSPEGQSARAAVRAMRSRSAVMASTWRCSAAHSRSRRSFQIIQLTGSRRHMSRPLVVDPFHDLVAGLSVRDTEVDVAAVLREAVGRYAQAGTRP